MKDNHPMNSPSKPNIILINCDDLGYGDLGCYGSKLNQTPAIDRLAAEGLRLTDFYMASPVCSPSRGAMLTGCYPPRIGFAEFDGRPVLFPGQGVGLNPDEISLARLLKQGGVCYKNGRQMALRRPEGISSHPARFRQLLRASLQQ